MAGGSTFIMASWTRSLSMSPFALRLLIRASLLEPELRHAMLTALVCSLLVETDAPHMKRVNLVKNRRVNECTRQRRG
jgi:hypothetical protein